MEKLSILNLKPGIEYAAYDGDRRLSKTYMVTAGGRLMNRDGSSVDNSESGESELGGYAYCEWVPLKASIRFVALSETTQTKGDSMTQTTKAKLPKVAELKSGNILGMQEGVVYVADSGPLAGVRVTRVGGKIQRVRNTLGKEITDSKVDLATVFKPVGKITLEQNA